MNLEVGSQQVGYHNFGVIGFVSTRPHSGKPKKPLVFCVLVEKTMSLFYFSTIHVDYCCCSDARQSVWYLGAGVGQGRAKAKLDVVCCSAAWFNLLAGKLTCPLLKIVPF